MVKEELGRPDVILIITPSPDWKAPRQNWTPSPPLEEQRRRRRRESPHKALIGLWERPDRPWIGFRKPGYGEGRRGSLNRTHASFLNSLAGPERGEREWVGGGIKESIGSWEGRAAARGLFNASLILNAAATTEKLQFITIPPVQACTETDTRKVRYTEVKPLKLRSDTYVSQFVQGQKDDKQNLGKIKKMKFSLLCWDSSLTRTPTRATQRLFHFDRGFVPRWKARFHVPRASKRQ